MPQQNDGADRTNGSRNAFEHFLATSLHGLTHAVGRVEGNQAAMDRSIGEFRKEIITWLVRVEGRVNAIEVSRARATKTWLKALPWGRIAWVLSVMALGVWTHASVDQVAAWLLGVRR